MPVTRPRRARGIVTGLVALSIGALLLWHGLLSNIGGALSMVETFLPWLGAAILVLGVISLVRLSMFGAIGVSAAAVAWALVFVPSMLPRLGTGNPRFTVTSENIESGNPKATRIARGLVARTPDVIALQELGGGSREKVQAVLDTAYRYSATVGTVGVWSKFAITDSEPLDLELGWKRALRIDLDTPEHPTRLYAVHIESVRPWQYKMRNAMLSKLSSLVRADDSPRLMVVGDFNTASTDHEFTQLSQALTEAQDGGFEFTWPAAFPLVRIDHILVRGLTAVSSTVLPADGSDHRGISVGVF